MRDELWEIEWKRSEARYEGRGGVGVEGDGLALISKMEMEGDRQDTRIHRGRRATHAVGWGHCEPTRLH